MADARSVIIPPEDVRKQADKSAEYVAKNGLPFEELLHKESQGNNKFCFLQHNNPYRPYYDQKVIEFSRALASGSGEIGDLAQMRNQSQSSTAPTQKENEILLNKDIKAPNPDQFSYNHIPVARLDMDIIKHSAQFVAENGQRFLIALTEREKNNPQFEFLKPTHNLFPYFTTQIDSYSTIMNMFKNKKNDAVKHRLMTYVADKHEIFTRAGQRFEYENMQKQMKKKRDEIEEEERNKMAMIDWNDFVVVQTIDFKDDDNLPAPRDLSQVEKANKILFNKNNINPEFAFLLDPSNLQTGLPSQKAPTSTQGSIMPQRQFGENDMQKYPLDQKLVDHSHILPPPRDIIPSFLQKSVMPTTTSFANVGPRIDEEINLNIKLDDDQMDASNKDRTLSIKINTNSSIAELKDRLIAKLGNDFRSTKLRHATHDFLDENKMIRDYNFLNGTSLELSTLKRFKNV